MVAVNKRYTIHVRRKREGKTDYKKRLSLLKSGNLRLVVRSSLSRFIAQLVKYEASGDKVLVSTSSSDLKKMGWPFKKNLPTGYLVGLLLAQKAKQKKLKGSVVLDAGFTTPIAGSRLFAVAKGCVDGGLELKHSPEVFPSEERIRGEHISKWASETKDKGQFAALKKAKADPSKVTDLFEKTKVAITGMVK